MIVVQNNYNPKESVGESPMSQGIRINGSLRKHSNMSDSSSMNSTFFLSTITFFFQPKNHKDKLMFM